MLFLSLNQLFISTLLFAIIILILNGKDQFFGFAMKEIKKSNCHFALLVRIKSQQQHPSWCVQPPLPNSYQQLGLSSSCLHYISFITRTA